MQADHYAQWMNQEYPPSNWGLELKALWYDKKGMWEEAHEIVQDGNTSGEALIHAYLHRKEGDLWNADYWYRRAGRKRPDLTLEEEWDSLFNEFLQGI